MNISAFFFDLRSILLFSLFTLPFSLFTYAQKAWTLGADVSWCTQSEQRGQKYYDYRGNAIDAITLMHDMGLSSIRLRVWVNPEEHGNWCNTDDVIAKAQRAKALGMDIMIDFHYSDWWADPGKQNIPAAWQKHKYKQLLTDVAEHTTDVLTRLKEAGITPRWVQVGNETSNGMLWPIGKIRETEGELKGMWMDETQQKQYAGLFKAGYDAVKAVFPEALVVVHLDKGYDQELYMTNLDALKNNGAKWDLIGMSVYPYWAFDSGYTGTTERLFTEVMTNIRDLYDRYGTESMIVETGFLVDEEDPQVMCQGRDDLAHLIDMAKTQTDNHCRGIMYWEPTCRPSQYKLGAFHEDGTPTEIMRAFTIANAKESKNFEIKNYDRPIVTIETDEGKIIVELYNETPKHRDNFLKRYEAGKLKNLNFHRRVKGFIIQGGDENDNTTIEAEIQYPRFFHKRGALAAAREDDAKNPTYRSSAAQFYIVWGNASHLEKTYTVFGEVIDGLEVVERIMNK